MNTLAVKSHEALASDIRFDSYMMYISWLDGRELSIPIDWFPKLRNANEEQRNKWRLIGRGIGIHWEEIDEDISIPALL